ncbi:class I SAM-dependent methyltransferase [Zavarzinia sp. CC-PAN008]|uniref:class I SAM-dependent methyltransferase n=1 Tax=Zavarzinia sp. CC-PAN008 TaxID=3243332 RepID=UPI003F746AF5
MTDQIDQRAYWNGEAGQKWVASQQDLDQMLHALTVQALAAADPRPGETVIDLGCGCGTTTLALADAVGPGGRVHGLDVSQPMLALAQKRRCMRDGVDFSLADIEAGVPEAKADLAFSRFGVMFFTDPTRAFRNIRAALKPGGRLRLLVWRPFKQNDWAFAPFIAAVPHLTAPTPPGPEDPGPFSFADPDRVRRILGGAGFADVTLDPVEAVVDLGLGRGLEQAMHMVTEIGPLSRLLADAGPAAREAALAAVRADLQKRASGDTIPLGQACWLVRATNPA